MSLTPKNWSEFQHYKDRSPTWIKLHRSILDNYEFSRLPVASRALAPMLWLLASEYDKGCITASFDEIAFRLRVSIDELATALKPLVDGKFFQSASAPIAKRKHPSIPEREAETELEEKKETELEEKKETELEGGDGVVARGSAKPDAIPGKAAIILIAGPLFKQFSNAYPGLCGSTAERKFKALLLAGENADQIIAAAPRANPDMPAAQWLEERAWAQLSLLPVEAPTKPPLISEEANKLGREIAEIAGQDWEFLEPGWCGAPYRCQEWLNQGWPRELIAAGVRAMVTAKAPEKINNVNYFDKGLARFIAQQTRPVPQIIELKPETVELGHESARHDPKSGVSAIGRVYDQFRAAAAEGEHSDGGEMSASPVRRLSS